ncbi:MAG: thiol-disulfide oxidoreductase DCC family protein, partial [Pikeienuella sp.]
MKSDHSYRADPAVPSFDESRALVVMDAECALCCRGARLIAQADKAHEFQITTAQSPLGRALLVHYGLNPDDPESWLYLTDGRAFHSLDAIIRVGKRLGGPMRLWSVFAPIPRGMQDWLYRRMARNRYRFGRGDMCALPDPE